MSHKLLFITESLAGGGAEKVLSVILKNIDKSKFHITLCSIVNTGIYIDELSGIVDYKFVVDDNSRQKNIFKRILNSIKYKLIYDILPVSWVYFLFIPKNNDTEVAFCEGFATKLLSKSLNKRAKKIAWVHTDLVNNPWPVDIGVYRNSEEEYRAYNSYDRIVCVSETVKRTFCEKYGLADKLSVIYNPVDKEEIIVKSKETEISYPYNGFRIITVGRLVKQKGFDRLIRITKRLKDNGFNITLDILGDGPLRHQLKMLINEYGLGSSVNILGFHSNPYPIIACHDLFVCSSYAEGFSLVMAEAMILGLPVISTYCAGPNELLDDGKYGLLVENDDAALFSGIAEVISHQELLAELRMKAGKRSSFFNLSHTIKQIETMVLQ